MSKLGEVSASLFHFSSIGLSISCCLALETTEQQQQQSTHRCLWCVWGCVFPHMVSSELCFTVLQSLSFCSSAESCSFWSRADSLSRVSFILPTFTCFSSPLKGKTHYVCVLYHIYFWKAHSTMQQGKHVIRDLICAMSKEEQVSP